MRLSIELGGVYQLNHDERPVRVIAFDDKVVMYDGWWSHANTWGMAKLTGRCIYYRMDRDVFAVEARYLRTDTYTNEEYNVHRPDLPFRFACYDSLSWYTQQPNSEAKLERQLDDSRAHQEKNIANTRLASPAIYLAPFRAERSG